MIKLRNEFRTAGLNRQERKITYAIKHCETMSSLQMITGLNERKEDAAIIESVINYVLFDYTTRWGMEPWRALKMLFSSVLSL